MYYKNVANFFLKKIFFDYADFLWMFVRTKRNKKYLEITLPALVRDLTNHTYFR